MTFSLDLNAIATVLVSTLLAGAARYLWKTSTVVTKLEIRVDEHEKRLDRVEEKVA
jgi:hypothetical protein